MNHVSIFEQKWLDLVFEGKNKTYGAYQLRQENPRTTLAAMFYGLLFLSGVAGTLALFSFMGKAPEILNPIDDDVLHVTNVHMTPPKQPENAATPLAPKEPKPSQNLPPVAAPTPDPEPTPVPTDAGPATTGPATPGPSGPSTAPVGPSAITSPELPNDGPVITALLDKLPEYPGGINNFYQYVSRNFEKPEVNEATTMRVMVSFVIEKDGSMTDIKVTRDPGYGMGKEAIRVLKSLKVQWKPGLIKGKPVRTSYNLPITVNMQ